MDTHLERRARRFARLGAGAGNCRARGGRATVVLGVGLCVGLLAGCGPESTEVVVAEEMSAAVTPWSEHAPPHEPEVVAPIPERREATEPYEPEEWHYSKESDPCEISADEARREFQSAYLAAGSPRLAFITSMTGPDVVGGKTQQETGEAYAQP